MCQLIRGRDLSGWSGEWDNGLVEALNRRNNKRFSSYWTIRGELGEVGKRLVAQQEFDIVHISDADTFFSELLEKVTSLQDINTNHPLSPKIASATVKRYLVDEKYKIRLSDYVLQEAKNLKGKISPTDFPFNVRMLQMEIYPRTKSYEELIQILQAMFIVGFYWGKPEQLTPFLKAFSLIASPPRPDGTVTTALQNLSYYPGLLLFYSSGIASIANNNYKALHHLFSLPITRNDIKRQEAYILQPTFVLENDLGKMLRKDKNEFTPTSNHLFDILRPSLSEIFPSDDDYQAAFDKFEYLLSLSSADIRLVANENGWGSIGCFSWRGDTRKEILEEYSLHKEEWIVLKSGLFGGSMERFRAARQAIEDLIGRSNIH